MDVTHEPDADAAVEAFRRARAAVAAAFSRGALRDEPLGDALLGLLDAMEADRADRARDIARIEAAADRFGSAESVREAVAEAVRVAVPPFIWEEMRSERDRGWWWLGMATHVAVFVLGACAAWETTRLIGW